MADELNIPIHRWYEPRNNISLPNSDFSKQWIYDSGIQKIDRWINSQPWGNPIPGLFSGTAIGIWLDPSDVANLAWRRNLLTYSEQFGNAIWLTNANMSKGAAQTDPLGGNTAIRISATGTNADFYQVVTVPAGTYVNSIWVRRVTGSGTVNLNTPGNSGVAISLTSSWQRFTVSSSAAGGGAYIAIRITTSGDAVDVAFAQFEAGTVATDYQRISDVNTEVIERFPSATLYQDTAGTTPVTTPGQTVGLMLDKSKGLALGSELVTNGDFASGTGWSVSAQSSISAGSAKIVSTDGTFQNISQNKTLTGPAWYEVSFDVLASASGSLNFSFTGAGVNFGIPSGTGRKVARFFVSSTTSSSLSFGRAAGVTDITIDNISVRELPGNHATQATLASRPNYGIEPVGGRRNLLTPSQPPAATSGIWGLGNATGVTSGEEVTLTVASSGAEAGYRTTTSLAISTQYTVSAEFKYGTSRWALLRNLASNHNAWFDIQNGAVGTVTAGATATIALGSDGFYRCALTSTTGGAIANNFVDFRPASADGSFNATAPQTLIIRRAQLELGSTATPYQRVTTAFDVTEAGVQTCHYVQYDGSDDGMITNSIDFTATDKMSVFAGVRKLSDANVGVFAELSSIFTNPGSFALRAPKTAATANYDFISGGTTSGVATAPSTFAAPITNVLTGLGDISGDLVTLRANGTIAAQSTGDQGTGNFGNYKLNLGRRGNDQATPTLPFFGRDYGIVVVGKATTATEITSTESWLAAKTGFYAPVITGVPTIGVS